MKFIIATAPREILPAAVLPRLFLCPFPSPSAKRDADGAASVNRGPAFRCFTVKASRRRRIDRNRAFDLVIGYIGPRWTGPGWFAFRRAAACNKSAASVFMFDWNYNDHEFSGDYFNNATPWRPPDSPPQRSPCCRCNCRWSVLDFAVVSRRWCCEQIIARRTSSENSSSDRRTTSSVRSLIGII